MSTRSSSGREKKTFPVFDLGRSPSEYSTDNLKAFIKAARPEANGDSALKRFNDEYDRFTKDLQLKYAREFGLNAQSRTLGLDIIKTPGANARYKAEVRDFVYNYVRNLAAERRLLPLGEGGMRTIKDVDDQPMVGFAEWFRSAPAALYNANALVAAATKVSVPGRTNLGKGLTGEAKKEAIYNAVLDTLSGAAARAPAAAAPSSAAATTEPRNFSELNVMRVVDLRALARNRGIKGSSSMDKLRLIDELARTLGFEGEAGVNIMSEEDIANIIDEALSLAGSDVNAAKQMIRDIGLANLDSKRFSVKLARELAKKLGITEPNSNRTVTTKAGFISALGLGETARTVSARATRDIKTDLLACRVASPAAVKAAAESLNINYRSNESVESICDQIYAAHLLRVSNLLLNKLEGTGAQSLSSLANLSGLKLTSAMETLQRNLSLATAPRDITDLLNVFLRSHYEGRARQLYPVFVNDVRRFLLNGTVPTDPRARLALAVVFSDLRGDLYRANDAEIAQQLDMLYNNVLQRIAAGNVEDFRRLLGNFGYRSGNLSSRSRSPSPVSPRSASPRSRSPSPVSPRSASPRSRSPSPRLAAPAEAEFAGDVEF